MNFVLDKGTGYMYAYAPSHYCANGAGKVMEHVFVMAEHIGRPLNKNECVHHKDRDRTNNSIDNLLLMTLSEHAKLHQMEDNGVIYHEIKCNTCDSLFFTTDLNRKYCSHSCSHKNREKFDIPKEDLYLLVWTYPTTEVAKMLGVSDVAVAKRCKKFNISKPSRGYWRKVETGTFC